MDLTWHRRANLGFLDKSFFAEDASFPNAQTDSMEHYRSEELKNSKRIFDDTEICDIIIVKLRCRRI